MVKPVKDKRTMLNLGLIDEPKGMIRMEIEEGAILELCKSIEAIGQLQPILVRPIGERYEVVYGHRRFIAHQRLGKARIWVTVKELDDVQVALMRATENLARLDMSPIEEAAVYVDLRDKAGLTLETIAKKMGKTVGLIKRRMDLLKMPPELQQAIHTKQLTYGVAESLWGLGDMAAISYYLPFAIEHGATVKVVRQWVKDHKDSLRREQGDVGGSGGLQNPNETLPVYVACDLCKGSMKLGEETPIRACPGCVGAILEAMKPGQE